MPEESKPARVSGGREDVVLDAALMGGSYLSIYGKTRRHGPSAAEIAASLGARLVGPGRWMARCVAHEDREPSLSITERDGQTLLHCFAGCPQDEVLAALRARGLWPEKPQRGLSTAESRSWAQRLAERAKAVAWQRAVVCELECLKAEALAEVERRASFEAVDAWRRSACALFLAERLTGESLIRAYRKALAAQQGEVLRLLAWARAEDVFSRRLTAVIVAILTVAENRAAG
jgi:hypothetical protein